jgi:DNA-binding MarR family transcriptional regulator
METGKLQDILFEYLDQIKVLISSDIWSNILLDCTKNELLILLLLYRRNEVNMSKLAEYINAPVNTATGIVARMEKREMVVRQRSEEDKRVVTICLSEKGRNQIGKILSEFLYFGEQILLSLSSEEMNSLNIIFKKVLAVISEGRKTEDNAVRSIRKITIE